MCTGMKGISLVLASMCTVPPLMATTVVVVVIIFIEVF